LTKQEHSEARCEEVTGGKCHCEHLTLLSLRTPLVGVWQSDLQGRCEGEARGNLIRRDCGACSEPVMRLLRPESSSGLAMTGEESRLLAMTRVVCRCEGGAHGNLSCHSGESRIAVRDRRRNPGFKGSASY
jgi:hypothetical protein